jgi:hypothetical protein
LRVLRKIGKLVTDRWDIEPRDTTKARRALKVLNGVPLVQENLTWGFECSYREAIEACLQEESFADSPDVRGKPPTAAWEQNQKVRTIIRNAIRIDADQSDVQRVLAAIGKLEKDDDTGEEAGNEAAPKGWFREKQRQIEEN